MELELRDLVFDYCEKYSLSLKTPKNRLDYIIQNGDINVGIIVKDWKRAIGVDAVIVTERIMKSIKNVSRVIILTNTYSDPAKALSMHTLVSVANKEEFEEMVNESFQL